jgi:SpoVK/Ycf46/Vps4 family AAA+-type ATPase
MMTHLTALALNADEDADVFFILTTNRPDQLEPALASRPGMIFSGGALNLKLLGGSAMDMNAMANR